MQMEWKRYHDLDGFYVDLTDELLEGETMDDLPVGSDLMVLFSKLRIYLFITKKENNLTKVTIEDATNAKYWSHAFTLFDYTDELKNVLEKNNIKIEEVHDDEYNHWGISYSIEVQSHSFDVILEETKKIYEQLFNETVSNLNRSVSMDKLFIPFTLRKTKDNLHKTLTVNYDFLNRKFWDGNMNLETLLEVQHHVITTQLPNSEIIHYGIEDYNGMHLKYKIKLPIETTRKEAEEWIAENIKKPMISILETKLISV